MFRLTREIRFAINAGRDLQSTPTNSHAGYPTLQGFGHYFTLQITLSGDLQPATGYLKNIKEIDDVAREHAIDTVRRSIATDCSIAKVPAKLFEVLRSAWPGAVLHSLQLNLSPFLSVACKEKEHPMVRLNQKFEFSAAHRLHNPSLSASENRQAFGKCNNEFGHGHNYELQVTLIGKPDQNGLLIDVPNFEQIVAETVIDHFDHKFLNLELQEFRELIPSVENIAKVIYGLLKPQFAGVAKLASVTVWETPKTWCEYSE